MQSVAALVISCFSANLPDLVLSCSRRSAPLSDGPICRICHEGGGSEGLLSPCYCTGTLGTVHQSCLERWLSSSNTSYCELCHTEFSVERRPRPLTEVTEVCRRPGPPVITPGDLSRPLLCSPPQWLQDPGPLNEKRTLFCDMVCFLFITPLAAISGWLCLRGAQDHLHLGSWLQAVGLITLTVALFTIYVLWTLVGRRSPLEPRRRRRPAGLPVGNGGFPPSGILPLPLPAVLRVEKNQSESASAPPRSEGVQLLPAFPALRQADEEVGRRDYNMRTRDGAGGD